MNYRRGRKYVNRKTILGYYTSEAFEREFPDIKQKCLDAGVITLDELSSLFRIVAYNFFRESTITAVLTSKRISLIAKPDHMRRRRQVEGILSLEEER